MKGRPEVGDTSMGALGAELPVTRTVRKGDAALVLPWTSEAIADQV